MDGLQVLNGFLHHNFHFLFVKHSMSSGYFFIDVITFLLDDMKSVSNGNSEENVEKVLFLDVLNGLIFLTIDLGDDFFNAACAVAALSARGRHFIDKILRW